MDQHTTLSYLNLSTNHVEYIQIVKICIGCDTKILSNQGFFNKLPQDHLQESTTICGFCTNCKHHVLLSDCYDKIEIVRHQDKTIYFNYIYNENSDQFVLHNPMTKTKIVCKD